MSETMIEARRLEAEQILKEIYQVFCVSEEYDGRELAILVAALDKARNETIDEMEIIASDAIHNSLFKLRQETARLKEQR